MTSMRLLLLSSAMVAAAAAASLSSICSVSYLTSVLPVAADSAVTIDSSSVTANAVYNDSISGSYFYPDAVIDYCNVTFSYSHNGLADDSVIVQYFLPTPDAFANRYLSAGGGAYSIYGGSSLPGGIIYGAVSGATDGGFGGFNAEVTDVTLLANGTLNLQTIVMFGYQAHHELSVLGKAFTQNIYNMSSEEKLYSYYQACSEGGREGWSQVQRYADEWDGAIIGAPAFRYAFQQTQHLYSNVVEKTLGYYPSPCELEKINNLTITACDGLDGKVDGVVARSDLCKLHYNITETIGESYYCAASLSPFSSTPEQNGTITAEAVAVAQLILDGLHDLDDKQVYMSYQPGSGFVDAETAYNSTSGEWELSISGLGGQFVAVFLELVDADNLDTLEGVTYNTIKEWMLLGLQRYYDTLQTTWPDLTPYQKAGGKVLHFHGEQDSSVPTASSVRYYESVREIMYSNLTYNESVQAMDDWYKLFLIPGAAHCAPNDDEPNAVFPQTNFAVMIDWVENGVEPVTLNGTILSGADQGETGEICGWPLRPLWVENGTKLECEYDQASLDTWYYDLDGVEMPVY
jgi:tannase